MVRPTLHDDSFVLRMAVTVDCSKLDSFNHGPTVTPSEVGIRGSRSRWRLSLAFQKGMADGNEVESRAVLYLFNDTDIKVSVVWSLRIVDPVGTVLRTSKEVSGELECKETKGFGLVTCDIGEFARYGNLSKDGLIFDGKLHLVADLRCKITEGGYPKGAVTLAADTVLAALKRRLVFPVSSDFTLISCDGVHIEAHRYILGLRSPVFQAMLETDSLENHTGCCKIEDATAQSIRLMLAFMMGVEPPEWSFEVARDLFSLADKYQILDLMEKCSLVLAEGVTTLNVIDIMILAYRRSHKPLLNECFTFLEDNVEQATIDGALVQLNSVDVGGELHERWREHLISRRKRNAQMNGLSLEPAQKRAKN